MLTSTHRRNVAIRLGLASLTLLLSACQIVAPQSVPAPRLLPDQSGVSVAGVVAGPSTANVGPTTFTIKRDVLRDALSLTGKVVPTRSTQLTFRGSGTVLSVSVVPGQSVEQGDALAEFAPDDESLQTARAQATLAELALESEQTKLDELQSGTNKDSIQQLRVMVERDQAEIQKLEQEQVTVKATNTRADMARTASKSAADRKVTGAEVALQAAKDAVIGAQANVKQAQDDAQATKDKAVTDAASAAAAASSAVRVAQRQLDEATIRLAQAKSEPSTTQVTQQLETQQLRIDQETESLKDARAAAEGASGQSPSTDHPARQIAAEVASANASARALERSLAANKLELKHMQKNLEGAKAADGNATRAATYALEGAQEQLASLQQAEQRAQNLAKQSGTPVPAPRASLQSVEAAQAALKQAEATVATATINLEDAQAAQASPDDPSTAQFADHALTAARVQLSGDQAKLAALQNGNAATELSRQQARVSVLRDQAAAAAAAAQPQVTLKAPFKGTVADVGIASGQAVGPNTPGADSANAGVRIPAIRLIATGPTSIVADASEADVAQLNRGQTMDLSFPGLPGQVAGGTIVDVGSTATVKDNQVTYPVRIEIASAPPTLKLGMTAQANLSTTEANNVLVAPRRAIRSVGGRSVVDRVGSDGQLSVVPVQVGRISGTSVEVVEGVQEGDVVAVYDGLATSAAAKQP